MSLQDVGQLANYYNQISLDMSFSNSLGFPNAIYLDAMDVEGVIRTGTALTGAPDATDPTHEQTAFAYSDTLILYTLRKACGQLTAPLPDECTSLDELYSQRRAQFPLTRWDDDYYGRHSDWPPITTQLPPSAAA